SLGALWSSRVGNSAGLSEMTGDRPMMRDAQATVHDSTGTFTLDRRALTLTHARTTGETAVTQFGSLVDALTAWRSLTGARARPRRLPRHGRRCAAVALARRIPQPRGWR